MKKVNTSIRLKQVMSESHLRQVDILERTLPLCAKYDVKMNKSDISQYVSGKVEPNQDKLFVLSLALNVSEGWLMGYDVPKSRSASSSAAPELAGQEGRLLVTFRRLNKSQQERLIAYAEGMLDAGTSAVTDAFHHYGFMSAPVSKVSEGATEYRCDVEQARREAEEIVRKEYEKAVKLKSGAK